MTGESLTHKLLRSHLATGELVPGTDITVAVDQVLIEDATGTMCAMQYELLGAGSDAADVQVPLAMYVDHNVLQIDDKNMQDHRYLQTFSHRHGLRFSPPGHGISHYVHLERFAKPGELLVGADSHTTSAGALGMFATDAGGLEVAVAMAGYGFDLPCPRVVGVELTGALDPGVEAKDVILELLRRHGVRGGRGAVFEFFGDGVAAIRTSGRATICNMVVEAGATAGVFPSDDETRRWLQSQDRAGDFRPLAADPGAHDDEVERIDLAALHPLVALPSSPGNVVPVTDVAGTPVVQVCVGSSVNSSYEDLATVAAMLREHKVAPGVILTVTPGSRQILDTIIRSGVYGDLFAAGARMLEPVCGPCVGIGQAPLSGRPSLRTFNRNFPGRSGTAEDAVYLCSPSTAGASALTGVITDPRTLPRPELRPAVRPDTTIHDHHIDEVLPPERRRAVEVKRGENLVPPPLAGPLPERIDAEVLIVVPDDVSTGDMAPDGAIAISVWSNIAACARFMFLRFDPAFPDRAQERGEGLIIGGHNYGQGSSREHAALAPLHPGRAGGRGRQLRADPPAQPDRRRHRAARDLRRRPGGDRGRAALADRRAGRRGALGRRRRHRGGRRRARDPVGADAHPGERAVLAAGGLLAHVRDGGHSRVRAAGPPGRPLSRQVTT